MPKSQDSSTRKADRTTRRTVGRLRAEREFSGKGVALAVKKKGSDAQKTSELVQKLQASMLAEKREKKAEQDADDAEFQAKIAGMLKNVTDIPGKAEG